MSNLDQLNVENPKIEVPRETARATSTRVKDSGYIIKSNKRFAAPGSLASSPGLKEEQYVSASVVHKTMTLEDNSVFSLSEIKVETVKILEKYAKDLKLNIGELISAICLSLVANGTARNKVDGQIFVNFADKKFSKVVTLSGDDEGTFSISPILREIQQYVKNLYTGIKTESNSANGGKLFLRCFANDSYDAMLQVGAPFRKQIKVAQKSGISSDKIALLSNPAFVDLKEVTKRDADAHLRIMANYLKRSRSKHAAVDVNGKEINREEIFYSLVRRMNTAHPDILPIDNTAATKMWTEGTLPTESDVDLGSKVILKDKIVTLLEMFQINQGKIIEKTT